MVLMVGRRREAKGTRENNTMNDKDDKDVILTAPVLMRLAQKCVCVKRRAMKQQREKHKDKIKRERDKKNEGRERESN